MRILLTGATSFVGRHFVQHFAQHGADVTASYRTRSGSLRHFDRLSNVRLIELDLGDATAFGVLPTSIDAVVHVAAASPAEGVGIGDMVRANVLGTSNLISYALAAGARRVVYASSLSIYGRVELPVVDEATPIVDPDVYGASKYLGERMLAETATRLPAFAIRLPGVLGPGAHRAWIPTLLERMAAGEAISIFNPEAPFNNAAYVDDLAAFALKLVQGGWDGFEVVTVAADGMISVREVADRLLAGTGSISTVSVRPALKPAFTVSSERAKSYGYRPMQIADMLNRYLAAPIAEA